VSQRTPALGFIFATVALDMLAFGIAVPVLPRLVEGFVGGDTATAAAAYGLLGTVFALAQFLSMPVLGGLSDRFGRRPVILLSNAGLALDHAIVALAPSLGWLVFGRLLAGVTAATVSTAFAYITDVTPTERRARAYGLIGAAFGLGFIVGPALGGVLGAIDLGLPFWVACGLGVANTLYGLLVLPESLPPERRRRFALRDANPLGALRLLREAPGLGGLAVVQVLKQLAHAVLPVVFVLYAGHRYGWDEATIGLSLAGVGVASATVQATLIGPAVRRLGERRTLLVGLACGTAGFAVLGLAPNGAWFWLGVPVLALWDLANPALLGLATARVGADRQGALQGAFGSLQGLTGLIAPAMFAAVFALGLGWGVPGLPFLLAAALVAASLAVAWRVGRAATSPAAA